MDQRTLKKVGKISLLLYNKNIPYFMTLDYGTIELISKKFSVFINYYKFKGLEEGLYVINTKGYEEHFDDFRLLKRALIKIIEN